MYKFIFFEKKNYVALSKKISSYTKIKHVFLKKNVFFQTWKKPKKVLNFFKVLRITNKETPEFYVSYMGKKIVSFTIFNQSVIQKYE